jgi:hypothetical protein
MSMSMTDHELAENRGYEIQYLRHLCSTILDVHAAVVMDTPDDQALHDKAISTFRWSLAVSPLVGHGPSGDESDRNARWTPRPQ